MPKPVKLLSAWFGPRPSWYGKFVAQMSRSAVADWECVPDEGPPAGRTKQVRNQVTAFNALAEMRLGTPCRKFTDPRVRGSVEAMCDYRPTYGELFADLYRGYEWWGWCDLDVRFGRFDELLPPLLADDADVVSFKPKYLSGCLTVLRNVPRVTGAFRRSRMWRDVVADPRYHCWDESGNALSGESFLDVLRGAGLQVRLEPDLYGYVPHELGIPCHGDGDRVFQDGREVMFCHFMDDVWPEYEGDAT